VRGWLGFQDRNSCAEVGRRVVKKFDDERMLVESGVNDPSLNASTATVHEPNLAQAGCMRRLNVLDDDRWHVPGSERMQVERVFDRDVVRFLLVHLAAGEAGLS
jgi:hypothetical protein